MTNLELLYGFSAFDRTLRAKSEVPEAGTANCIPGMMDVIMKKPNLLIAVGFIPLIANCAPAAEIDFAHDIVPLLRAHCGKCHLGAKKQGGFSMNPLDLLLAGGETGKAVEPGKSAASDLIKRITTDDPDLRMPPEGPRVFTPKILKR